jgi:uncharacterized protein YeeX (DUF496 family)
MSSQNLAEIEHSTNDGSLNSVNFVEYNTLLKSYYNQCKKQNSFHYESALYYRKLYIKYTIPVLILSSLVTVLSTFNTKSENNIPLSICIAVFSGVLTASQSLMAFLEYGERSNNHKNTLLNYNNLKRNIKKYLLLYEFSDTDISLKEIKNIIETIHKDYSNIENTEPLVPFHILKNKELDWNIV